LKNIEPPKNLKAKIASLSAFGVSGGCIFLQENNFGGCLADDMGLGENLANISTFC